MNKIRLYILLFIIVSLGWVACTQQRQPCVDPTIVPLQFGIYKDSVSIIDTGLQPTILVFEDSPYLSSPYVGALDSGKVKFIYHGAASATNKFAIPMSSVADSCKWIVCPDSVSFLNNSFDTFSFYYDRQLQFLSNACGYTYYYNLHQVTSTYHNIDSIIVVNYNVTSNANAENLKVYIK